MNLYCHVRNDSELSSHNDKIYEEEHKLFLGEVDTLLTCQSECKTNPMTLYLQAFTLFIIS